MGEAKKARTTEVALHTRHLKRSFEKERWDEVSVTLQSVAEIAQGLQRVELSLLAQSLKSDLDFRVREKGAAIFHEVVDRYDDLVRKLEHLSWSAKL